MRSLLRYLFAIQAIFLTTTEGKAQCFNRINHLSGTTAIACNNITVTSDGSAGTRTVCTGIGPYLIGENGQGSYTFSFSHAVAGVSLDFVGFDNGMLSGHEEVMISIDGTPYFLTDPGAPNGCSEFGLEITPSGTLTAFDCGAPNCHGAANGIHINQTIHTITVEDNMPVLGVIFSMYFCCSPCQQDAGILGAAPLSLCQYEVASIPPATNTYLGAGDKLQYVLYADPSDPLNSIISVKNNPVFGFDPATMQTDVTYFIAAVAGESLNGNVNLSGSCIDFSNMIEIVWRPSPGVSFTSTESNICAGQCIQISAVFTGKPPFTLTYVTPTGPITNTFPDYIGSFEICAPPNTATQNFVLRSTMLKDALCTCH